MAEYHGTIGDDVYSGTAEGDQIYGNGGKDQLSGADGADYIEGGDDDDTLNGEAGDDELYGGAGNDVIDGGAGHDFIFGDLGGTPAGNDVINGGDGSDSIFGGGGADQLTGGADGDFLSGEAGNDILVGGSGNDGMNGGAGVDSFDGGTDAGGDYFGYGDRVSFSDRAATQGAIADLRTGQISNDGFGNAETMTNVESLGGGTAYADTFYGTDLSNALLGGRGDTLMSFGGDDLIRINGAPAVLDAGAGIDTLRLDNVGGFVPDTNGDGLAEFQPPMSVGYTIDLAAGTLTDGYGVSGSVAGIERIEATQWSDVLRGSGADEFFRPGDSDDTVDGRGGIDTLSYAYLTHYDYYPENRGGVFVDLAAGQVIETFIAYQTVPGPQEDRVMPSNATAGPGSPVGQTDTIAGIENVEGTGMGDTIWGDGADNRIAPGAGNDVVDGRGGIDTVDYSTARASVVVRLDQGTAVEGGTGETSFQFGYPDEFFGNIVEADDYAQKTDQLANIENAVGSAFADTLVGDGGANRLEGGDGDDSLTGGAGADILVGGAGTDTADWSLEAGSLGIIVNLSDAAEPIPGGLVLNPGQARDSYGNVDTLEGIENFKTGSGVDLVYGNAAANRIETGAGADFLYGGAGVDTLIGGTGDDSYYILAEDSANFEDLIVELQGGGTDAILTTFASFSLAGLPEIEYLIGFADIAFTLTGNDLGNYIQGNASGDTLIGGLGNDELVGLGGNDIMRGGLGDDTYRVEEAGDVVEENAGEGTDTVVTSLAAYSLLGSNVENLFALNNIAHEFRGSAANNVIISADFNDRFLLQDGGEDLAVGGGGNDVFYFGAALSAGDIADGGEGRDAIVLQGNVTVALSETNLDGIESISIQSGANASFGDTANNFYDYDVTTADGNVAAGQQLIVNAQSLRAGEDFTFDGSAETDGKFLIYGGHGTDNLTGGDGVDVFFFEGQRWTAGDKVDGGDGRDALVISGGSGLTHIEFAADSFTNIESISVNNRYATDPSQKPSYQLVLNNGNVALGATLIVNGSSIPLGQVVNIDGRAVQDGNLILFGGGGHDVLIGGAGADLIIGGGGQDSLTGGAGADTFRYDAVSDSPAGATDLIADFQTGTDKIDLSRIDANTLVDGDQAFSWIGASAFSGAAGELRVRDDGGYRYVEGDTNGDGTADFAIAFYAVAAPQVQGDFIF